MGMDSGQGPGGPEYPPPPQSDYPPQSGGYPPPPPPGYAPPGGGYSPPPPGYPPAGGGYPPPGYAPGYGPPAGGPPIPAGVGNLFQKWLKVTTKPGISTFATELPTANWSDIWVSLIGLGILTAITGYIGALEFTSNVNPFLTGLTPQQRAIFDVYFHPNPAVAFGSIISVPLGFFIGQAILFVSAKIFGGRGSFKEQAYAYSLFYVPIGGLSAIVGLVPVLGGIVAALLGVYEIVLGVMAMAASQRLSVGRAIGAVLLPVVVVLVLACAFVFVIAAIIAASLHGAPTTP